MGSRNMNPTQENAGGGGEIRMRKTLRPLEPAEQAVAAQNFWMVESFLRQHGLPLDDWLDVVIFRYLLTVERWFDEPALYRYKFSTIAWSAMRSAVGHEREKQARRIKTISLDAPVPGADGLTCHDIVTAENLDYTQYTVR